MVTFEIICKSLKMILKFFNSLWFFCVFKILKNYGFLVHTEHAAHIFLRMLSMRRRFLAPAQLGVNFFVIIDSFLAHTHHE
jgi:hypothetical protein